MYFFGVGGGGEVGDGRNDGARFGQHHLATTQTEVV